MKSLAPIIVELWFMLKPHRIESEEGVTTIYFATLFSFVFVFFFFLCVCVRVRVCVCVCVCACVCAVKYFICAVEMWLVLNDLCGE